MPYNFIADSFLTNSVADFLQAKCDFTPKTRPFSVFERLPLGGSGETYDDQLRLIGKRVVDFLLVLIELFSLGVTAEVTSEYRLKIGDFAPTWAG